MPFKHNFNGSFVDDGGTTLPWTDQVIADNRDDESVVIPINTTDEEIDIGWLNAALVSLFLHTSQTVHIKSNSTSEPGDQFDLVHGQPIQFVAGESHGGANPFVHADVEKLYVTNASMTKTATLNIRTLSNAAVPPE